MKPLLRWRREGPPLALVAAYAALVAASILWTALVPGRPQYGDRGAPAGIAVVLSALLVLWLASRSVSAWKLALYAHIFGLLLFTFTAVEERGDAKAAGLAVQQAVILAVLFSPALERWVHRRP